MHVHRLYKTLYKLYLMNAVIDIFQIILGIVLIVGGGVITYCSLFRKICRVK
jgi:hypothetical protein